MTGTIFSVDAAGPLPCSVTNPTRLGIKCVNDATLFWNCVTFRGTKGFTFTPRQCCHNLELKVMKKLKKVLPITAMLLVGLMFGCNKLDNTGAPGEVSVLKSGALKPSPNKGALAVVNLGVAGNFVVLSKTGITNVYPSVITGNIGTSPISGAAITGVTCPEVIGTIYTVNAAGPACRVIDASMLTTAVLNMQTAYTDAAGRSTPNFVNLGAGNIGGLTLTPGLYKFTTGVSIPTDVTIKGGPNDIWIFQIAGTLKMSSAKNIILSGGAQAKNIFWQVAGAVTLGTTSHFEGIILGKTGINLQTGASINGRTLAQTAVTLQKNTVTQPQ